jgi:hypothetical protein
MSSSKGPEIQKLGPSNYNQWSGEMQAWLRANQLWQIVSGQKPRPPASSHNEKEIEKQEAWDDKAEKAAGWIYLMVESSQTVTSPYVYIRLVLRPRLRGKIQWSTKNIVVLPTVSKFDR